MAKPWLLSAAFVLALGAPAFAQDETPPGEDEDQLTPEQAMEMLNDIHGLMEKSAELLNDSSRGKALETEKEILERLEKEFKDDPAALQKQITEKVKKLMQRSEKKQKDAIEKLNEIIKKAKTSDSQSQQKQQKQQQQQSQSQKQSGGPAQAPYDPQRNDPASKFRSKADRTGQWGDLPPKLREAMMTGKRDIDEYPEEFQQILREYMKKLADSKD